MDQQYLLQSFQQYTGVRGAHFYNEGECGFLPWLEVINFVKEFNRDDEYPEFEEKLITTLANYNPDCEFLALRQHQGDKVSIELYSRN